MSSHQSTQQWRCLSQLETINALDSSEQTEIGRTAKLLDEKKEAKTPLQMRLSVFSKYLVVVTLGVSLMVVVAGMLLAIMISAALQLAIIYVPVLNDLFRTQALPLLDLAACVATAYVVFIAMELEKHLVRRNLIYRTYALDRM